MSEVIDVKDLYKRFGHVHALNGLDLQVSAREKFTASWAGYVGLDLIQPRETSNAKIWSERLMELPVAVQPPDPSHSFPLVRYETLGGADGLK